jgi:antitoxin component YwqK of YwqJK toxin-antitoxin module
MLAAIVVGLALLAQAPGSAEVVVETHPDGTPRIERTVLREPDGRLVDHGPWESFHPGGKRESKGDYEQGKRVGAWEFRWPDGRMRARGPFQDGLEHGAWTTFHRGGEKESTGSYARGRRAGKWTFWSADGEIDAARTGVYGFAEETRPSGVVRSSGETFAGKKHGRWIYRWPNGARQLAVTYAYGELEDERFFFHRDDQLDPEWITRGDGEHLPFWAQVEATLELRPVESWTSSDAAVAEVRRRVDAGADRALEPAARRRELVPAALGELVGCDLGTPQGLARAAQVHALLCELFAGLGWPWDPATAPLLVQRWQSAWSLLESDEAAWELDFEPAFAWLELELADSALGQPPLPPDVIAGLKGERTARSVRRPLPKHLDERVAAGERWLAERRASDGAWRDGEASDEHDVGNTALALLVLQGEGHSLVSGEHQRAVRDGTRFLGSRQDAATGALGPPRAHVLATWALIQVELSSRPRGPRKAIERALAHLQREQRADGSFSDDPATGALTMFTLAIAQASGHALDEDVLRRAREAWLQRALALAGAGREPWAATVIGSAYFSEQFFSQSQSPSLAPLASWLGAHPSEPGGPLLDVVFGAWAAFQWGKPHWLPWFDVLEGPLLTARGSGESFPCRATAAEPGGALEASALQLLALQSTYRYAIMRR